MTRRQRQRQSGREERQSSQTKIERNLTNISSGDVAAGIKVDPDELAEPGAVVVLHGLGVAEGLKDGIGLQQLLFQLTLKHQQKYNFYPHKINGFVPYS